MKIFKSRQTKLVIYICGLPILIKVVEKYTRNVYSDFVEEFRSQLAYLCKWIGWEDGKYTYKITLTEGCYLGFVKFNSLNVSFKCSCLKFESIGILCLHTLKVFHHNNILHLSSEYILKRWTKYAKDGSLSNTREPVIHSDGKETFGSYYTRVYQKAFTIIVKATISSEVLNGIENRLDKLTMEVKRMLHQMNVNDIDNGKQKNIVSKSSNMEIPNNHIIIKPPPIKKSLTTKRIRVHLRKEEKRKEKLYQNEIKVSDVDW